MFTGKELSTGDRILRGLSGVADLALAGYGTYKGLKPLKGTNKVVVSEKSSGTKGTKIKRSQTELDDLARDPAHGGKIRDQGIGEREVGLGLEERGSVSGLKRDPSGSAEFIDSTGQKWDVKGFNSSYPPKKGGYTLDKSMKSIQKSISEGEYVMLDTRKLSPEHWAELKNELIKLGLEGKVIWWP